MSAEPRRGIDTAAILLAAGLVFAVAALALGVFVDAVASRGPGLTENATQVLTDAIGGISTVLGSYVGYHLGRRAAALDTAALDTSEPPQPPTSPPT